MPSSTRPARSRRARPAAGVSVVELLVVLGILIAIISSLVVGLNYASRKARVANTEFLMNSIMAGMVRFKAETGYLPPVLSDPRQMPNGNGGTAFGQVGWARDGITPPTVAGDQQNGPAYGSWNAQQNLAVQRWFSATTVPEYLLGTGDRSQDGYGVILNANGSLPADGTPGYREQPALGIRNPGQDGLWGALLDPRAGTAGNGFFGSRNLAVANANEGNTNGTANQSVQYLKGKSLGPYLEVKSDSDIGALTGFDGNGTPQVARIGEINNFELAPKVILDFFGKPILFYRRGYLNGDLKSMDRRFSLADVIALRPQSFTAGDAIDAAPDGNGDTSASRAAVAAECALLSFGPDTRWDPTVRADPAGYNEDNIVRFGP
jgi:type II secretory pathway pseudopilin PulG